MQFLHAIFFNKERRLQLGWVLLRFATIAIIAFLIISILLAAWHFLGNANGMVSVQSFINAAVFSIFFLITFVMTKNIFIAVDFHSIWNVFASS